MGLRPGASDCGAPPKKPYALERAKRCIQTSWSKVRWKTLEAKWGLTRRALSKMCPWGSMVAFPENREKEVRGGPHSGQDLRRDTKGGFTSQDSYLPMVHLLGALKNDLGSLRLWGEHPGRLPCLEGVYGASHSPQSISRLTQVVEEEVRSSASASWPRSTLGTFLALLFFLQGRPSRPRKKLLYRLF